METNVTNEYRPFDDNRFYPGMIDEERQRRLTDFDFELGELTADDLVWMLSKSVAATAYSALTFVRDKVSVEAAQALSRQFGYEAGVSLFNRFRAKLSIAPGEALTPEQFAQFQDYAHAILGVDAMYAFADYDDEKAWVSRHRCFFGGAGPFTNAPPDLVDICAYSNLGFISAYKELQPMLHWKNTHNMGDASVTDAGGQSICGSIMWMNPSEERAEEFRARRLRAKERSSKRGAVLESANGARGAEGEPDV